MEFSLLFAALMGALGVYGFLWWEARRGNAADCSRNLWDVALTAAVVGLFAGRLAAMIADGVNPVTNPADVLIVRSGVATGVASLTALATVAVVARRELPVVFDGLAAAALGGLAGWHAGCTAREACLGTPSDLPWAYALEGSAVARHPVELYAAALFLLAGAALAWYKARRRPAPLVPAGLALVAAGVVRLATEPMRPVLGDGPVAWYAAAVLAGAALVSYATVRRVRSRRAESGRSP